METIPAPDTAHPDLENHADSIRAVMHKRNPIKVMKPELSWHNRIGNSTVLEDVRVLSIKTHYGLAPYVGKPFIYFWESVSDDELWVAGSARIEYIPDGRMAKLKARDL